MVDIIGALDWFLLLLISWLPCSDAELINAGLK
jgi:hypothetical protein